MQSQRSLATSTLGHFYPKACCTALCTVVRGTDARDRRSCAPRSRRYPTDTQGWLTANFLFKQNISPLGIRVQALEWHGRRSTGSSIIAHVAQSATSPQHRLRRETAPWSDFGPAPHAAYQSSWSSPAPTAASTTTSSTRFGPADWRIFGSYLIRSDLGSRVTSGDFCPGWTRPFQAARSVAQGMEQLSTSLATHLVPALREVLEAVSAHRRLLTDGRL